MKWNLVVFDDQIENIECLKEVLGEGFNVVGCQDVTTFPQVLGRIQAHALLVDVHMPVIDGHALFQKIAAHPVYNGCPVFFISGDPSDEVKLKSYQEGAMDFFSRTIRPEEMVIRLSNKIRFFVERSTNLGLGNLEIDASSMKAAIAGKTIDLTLLELRLLSHVVRSYPRSLSRTELIEKIWGSDPVKPGTINTHLTNLKPKLEPWDYVIKVRDDSILILGKTAKA
jgi:DNA-binding response OmpR family regulator